MAFSAKVTRKQISLLKSLLDSSSLDMIRLGQNKIGDIIHAYRKDDVITKEHEFESFSSLWVLPRDERRTGVLLYLHGGGYAAGDIGYVRGIATVLATESGNKVFAPAYRLAPEHPFPAALEDAVESYKYLIKKGYSADKITLVGESAGGGLCYALVLKLCELSLPIPSGIIAISPWTDLLLSSKSYEDNKTVDPTMSKKLLDFYAKAYTDDRTDPYVSPLFADLSQMPPSLIIVGGDEIMLDDSKRMHEKLLEFGRDSHLLVKPNRWHAYLLYGLKEDKDDFKVVNAFLNRTLDRANKLRWMKLDNAAKIYPAAQRQNWSNVYRLSATLKEEVDKKTLENALDVVIRRFPSIATRLKRGVFWYYLEQISSPPEIREESSHPLVRMSRREISKCAFRVIVYKSRIAIEFFHSLTDGNGALVFLKTLLAEYITQRYGVDIVNEKGVLPRLEEPSEAELEDSFLKYSGAVALSRRENTAWHLFGIPEKAGFLNVTTFKLPLEDALKLSHSYGVSLTAFLTSALMRALSDLQKEKVENPKRRKPIRVLIPVNLRNVFESKTLRNFALYTTPEIDLRLGDYSFSEICKTVHHRMGLDVNRQHMSSMIAANVNSEKSYLVRVMPLVIKDLVMKAVFDTVGERKSCLAISNLGKISLPDAMTPFIERFDFILGTQANAPYNCGVLSFGDTLYISFIRNTEAPELERAFFKVLQELSLSPEVESNKN